MVSQIDLFANAKWSGGSGISLDPSSPETMGNTFKAWEDSYRANPKPIVIQIRHWMDSADVQAIVNTKSKEVQDAFNAPFITQVTRDTISKENGKMMILSDSV